MSKFKFASHGDKIAEARMLTDAASEVKEEELKHSTALMLNIRTGDDSSGTKALVETQAYKKWLAEQQEKNIFIGKSYMQHAPEFEHNSEEIEAAKALEDNEALALLMKDADGQIRLKDDVNAPDEGDGEALDGAAQKFVDLCVINRVVSERIGWDIDDVLNDVISALNEEHSDDAEFTIPEDLEHTVQLSMEAAEYKAQLGYDRR